MGVLQMGHIQWRSRPLICADQKQNMETSDGSFTDDTALAAFSSIDLCRTETTHGLQYCALFN